MPDLDRLAWKKRKSQKKINSVNEPCDGRWRKCKLKQKQKRLRAKEDRRGIGRGGLCNKRQKKLPSLIWGKWMLVSWFYGMSIFIGLFYAKVSTTIMLQKRVSNANQQSSKEQKSLIWWLCFLFYRRHTKLFVIKQN